MSGRLPSKLRSGEESPILDLLELLASRVISSALGQNVFG